MNRLFIAVILTVAAQGAAQADSGKQTRRAPGSDSDTVTVSPYSVLVTVDFEDVTNLAGNLVYTGALITLPDLALTSRLPDPAVTIPVAQFPVLVDITALPLLQFNGVAEVTLDTEDLPYSPDTRLRLFSADDALSPFRDITEDVSEGSYRVRGSRGEFSQFLIVHDARDPADIVDLKFVRVNDLLATHMSAIDATLYATLNNLISVAETNWLADNIDASKAGVQSFGSAIEGAIPGQIPNTWSAASSAVNVAGLLRSAARTLHFSLEDARDSDADGIYDYTDNCLLADNASQCDTDGDGYGNRCDADLDNNGIVNSFDLNQLRASFGATGAGIDADLNCDGSVNSFDLNIMRSGFGVAPGPAANLP